MGCTAQNRGHDESIYYTRALPEWTYRLSCVRVSSDRELAFAGSHLAQQGWGGVLKERAPQQCWL